MKTEGEKHYLHFATVFEFEDAKNLFQPRKVMILAWRRIPFMLTVADKSKIKGYEALFMPNTRTFPFEKRHNKCKDILKSVGRQQDF
jgi:hypothetical protein